MFIQKTNNCLKAMVLVRKTGCLKCYNGVNLNNFDHKGQGRNQDFAKKGA